MSVKPTQAEKRFFIPEVIQTSAMDCGPASLKAMLEGFGISVSYGRLREACQTSVDGTSIDTMEDVSNQLGLEAEQIMVPTDHLLLSSANTLPAIVVVKLPNGMTHFVVVWSRHGRFLQIMDPGIGRRWQAWERFLADVYVHSYPISAQVWRDWAGSEGFIQPLKQRFERIGIGAKSMESMMLQADEDIEWYSYAAIDASLRLVDSLVRAKGITRGEESVKVLERFFQRGIVQAHFLEQQSLTKNIREMDNLSLDVANMHIPAVYWSVVPYQKSDIPADDDPQVLMRGAVFVRALGLSKARLSKGEPSQESIEQALLPELEAALSEPPPQPTKEIFALMREDGFFTPLVLIIAIAFAAFGTMVEAVLFQGILQIGGLFSMIGQRTAAIGMFFTLFALMTMMEFPITAATMQIGRKLESRLRIAFLEKLPKLSDRYFHSRLISDMTQRAHELRLLSSLPSLGVNFMRTLFQLLFTTIGIVWLDPISAPLAITATVFFIGLSLATKQFMEEKDLRVRTHLGALDHFYLDSLLGLIPARTHGAEKAIRREHETMMVEWARASLESLRLGKLIQAVSALSYSVFAIWIVFNYIAMGGQTSGILLLFYWTLNLPAMGQTMVTMTQQYPMIRNTILRILEPIQTPEEVNEEEENEDDDIQLSISSQEDDDTEAVEIEIKEVQVVAGGHTILSDINLHIKRKEHIGVVGLSGSGKSSLVGLLLGWHKPATGEVWINGEKLNGLRLRKLRQETAWVDPAIQIWNRSLYYNLQYGISQEQANNIRSVIDEADLFDLLARLPDGLQTVLGENGGLVSGGEGQRVRLGRAMIRPKTKLVILDEPFRGLDRQKRRDLLKKARQHWQHATLLCVTHDVSETLSFTRVLVIDNGNVIEDDAPSRLMEKPNSKYYALMKAEEEVRHGLWEGEHWRRFWLDNGVFADEPKKDLV